MYRLKMPGYAASNHLGAYLPLPDFYWTNGKTLRRNPRMNMMLGALRKRGAAEMKEIRAQARTIRGKIEAGQRL